MDRQIGIIGLGRMGLGIAARLKGAGFEVRHLFGGHAVDIVLPESREK